MNINLVYEGKDYNFDIPNGVTIDYLKELSSKIFNSDKALLDLVYNNQKIENTDDNTLIRDLIPEGETNTVLTVQINKDTNNNDNKNEIIPLVSLKTKIFDNDNDKEILKKIKTNSINKKENIKNDEKKDIKKKIIFHANIKDKSRNKNSADNNRNISAIKKEFDFKIFQSNFTKKNKELYELIKEFNNKLKEIYLYLYKKYKNFGGNVLNNNSSSSNNSSISSISIGINNNYYYELSIYMKKILNFEERQINYYRYLLELIRKYEKNRDILQLNDLYANLSYNNVNIKNNEKKDNYEPLKFLKFKNLRDNKLFSNNNNNNTLLGKNLTSLNINNDNHLPLLRIKNINSSLNLDKKNINFNYNNNNNISSIAASNHKNSKNNNSLNKQITNIEKEKDKDKDKSKKVNNLNNGGKTSKLIKNAISFDNKLQNNNNIKNSILNNKNENNNVKDKDKSDKNSSLNSENSSEKDLVDDITINDYKNKSKIAPIPLHIRNSVSTNILPRKFSVINNSLRSNSIINNVNNGMESLEKINEEKKKQKLIRFSTNNFQNKLKNTPNLTKKINLNDSPKKSKRKGLNDSINENAFINMKKIKDIDISSMTVNDSNFIRDKQKYNIKKNNNNMNKYDFFM